VKINLLCPVLLPLLWACASAEPDAVPTAPQPTSIMDPIPGPAGTYALDTALAYRNVITDYIAAMTKRDGAFPDTLYINRHEDFPDIVLPAIIDRTHIRVVAPAEAESLKGGEDFVCLNILGWFAASTAEFHVINFRQDWRHRPDGRDDCHLYYSIGPEENLFVLDSLRL
jgi:hypothetical protein